MALLSVGLLFFLGVVRMLGRWWFQDDPGAFGAFRGVDNPARFFFDLHAAREYGSGQGLVPMQMLDNWIDVHLPTPMPLTAYVHSLLTALAALVAVFFVLRRVTSDMPIAFAGAVVWMLLPSTAATCLYLSTRHYVEGLVFASVVFCLAARKTGLRPLQWTIVLSAAVASMLSKEIYAGLVPVVLIALGLVRRERSKTVTGLLLGLTYAVYRVATVGGGMTYAMPLLGPAAYLKYLATMPFTFAGSLLAYPIVLLTIWASIRYLRNGGISARQEFGVFAASLGATLFVVYPIAYAVVNSYRQPGTWYRGPFLPNTIVLIWMCLLAVRLAPRGRQVGLLAGIAASLLPGLFLNLRWWNSNMVQERVEGRFLLDHPDRLLFTDDPCWWYFVSLEGWYGVPHAPILLAERSNRSTDRRAVQRAGAVWSYQDGTIRPDAVRTKDYLQGVKPAFRGRSQATPP